MLIKKKSLSIKEKVSKQREISALGGAWQEAVGAAKDVKDHI